MEAFICNNNCTLSKTRFVNSQTLQPNGGLIKCSSGSAKLINNQFNSIKASSKNKYICILKWRRLIVHSLVVINLHQVTSFEISGNVMNNISAVTYGIFVNIFGASTGLIKNNIISNMVGPVATQTCCSTAGGMYHVLEKLTFYSHIYVSLFI